MVNGSPMSLAKNSCVGSLQLLMQIDAHPVSSRYRHLHADIGQSVMRGMDYSSNVTALSMTGAEYHTSSSMATCLVKGLGDLLCACNTCICAAAMATQLQQAASP